MAAIPTYLHLGDAVPAGGEDGVKPITTLDFSLSGNLAGLATMMHEMQRVVPSNSGGVLGANFSPYYDGQWVRSYTASAGGASTVSIAASIWKVNHHAGKTVTITAGTGAGQPPRTVASNTANTITTTTPWSVVPDATSVFNLGPGGFVPFHYIPDGTVPGLIPGAKGDNWFGAASITPTSMLMQRLGDLYANQAPGFRFLKFCQPAGMASWKTGGASWNAMMTRFNDMKGIEEGLGNTLDVRAVIIDCATTDIFTNNLGIAADVDGVIAAIRADVSATALIVFVMPSFFVGRTTHGAWAPLVRGVIRDRVAARQTGGDPHVSTYDMSGGTFSWNFGEPNSVEPADPRYYDLPTVILSGVGLFNTIQAHYAPPVTAPIGQALAGVVMLGDSQMTGQIANPLLAVYANQPSLTGPNPLSTVKPNVWIWDDIAKQMVLYDVTANSNTFGTAGGGMGPDVSLPRKLLRRYPQGVVILKYAKGGMALTPEAASAGASGYLEAGGALLESISERFTQVRVSCLQQTNRSMDVVGLAISCGENDVAAGESATAAFEARVGAWVDDIRGIFTTRVDGVLPIVWQLGPPPATEVVGGSIHGLAVHRNRYRARVKLLETQKPKFRYIRNEGPDDFELSKDNFHYGGESLLKLGDKFAEELLTLITSDDAGGDGGTDSGESEDFVPPGGGEDFAPMAAPGDDGEEEGAGEDGPGSPGTGGLVVEDGTGFSDAESFCSIEQFDAFWAKNGAPAHVTAATTAQKAAALRRVTREWVEGVCGGYWRGQIQFADQRLSFPRVGCHDDEGRIVPPNSVPAAIVEATALVAGDAQVLAGGSILPSSVDRGPVTRETRRGLGFEQTTEYAPTYSNASSVVRQMRAAEALVYPYVQGSRPGVSRS